ncbi:MAG: hydrogenase iron-sulfur subunit [Phycisphaerae bacterium]|jgi:F420-non-reducing hydrogenase iron-sulfur subunit
MAEAARPDVLVHVCQNCIPNGGHLPRQWVQGGFHVVVREVPCSGKTDAQYLFHALENGCQGVCVVTCPKAACHLAQGNYRAEVRIRTVQRLLAEIGLSPGRAQLLRCSSDESAEHLERVVRETVVAISEAIGRSGPPAGPGGSGPALKNAAVG